MHEKTWREYLCKLCILTEIMFFSKSKILVLTLYSSRVLTMLKVALSLVYPYCFLMPYFSQIEHNISYFFIFKRTSSANEMGQLRTLDNPQMTYVSLQIPISFHHKAS